MNSQRFKIRSKKVKKNNRFIISLEGDLGINQIENIKSRIESVEIQGDGVVIDFKNIDSFDLSTIQLMLAFKKYIIAIGKTFEMTWNDGEAMTDLVVNTGFGELLNIVKNK